MGQVLNGSATTTETVRRAIQRSEASVRALARHYSISPTTVQKWRKRTALSDQPMGPLEPHSTDLSVEQEAMIVAFRRHSLLPLGDCLYALQPTIPGLTRSSLHRCLASATAYPVCPICTMTRPQERNSNPTLSAFPYRYRRSPVW